MVKEKTVSLRVLRNLAVRLYKAERRRNITASIAIALSSMLVILVLSAILSVTDMLQRERQMLLGTQAEGIYLSSSYYWYEQLRDSGKFDEVEFVATIGTYETKSSAEKNNLILYAKEKTAAWNFNELLEGRWAQREGEIVVDELFVEKNGGDIQVGDKLNITMKTYAEEAEYELEVVGICASNYVLDEARIYVSEDYFWRIRSGTMTTYCRFEQGKYDEADLLGILREINTEADTSIIINGLMPEGTRSYSVIAMIAGVLFLTVLCAGLMIYAIYYISVVRNVVQYGQLKLVGVNERQIRILIWVQALWQYMTGFPLGCLAGVAAAYLVMPVVTVAVKLQYSKALIIEPQYFLYAALLSFGVMYFGIRKPMRIIGKIPPIHTVGFINTVKAAEKKRKSSRFTISRFAVKNLAVRKKKTFIVAFSMFLAIMLFVATTNLVNSMNVDGLLEQINLPADIVIAKEDALESIEAGYIKKWEGIPEQLEEKTAQICKRGERVCYYNIDTVTYLNETESEIYCEIALRLGSNIIGQAMLQRVNAYMERGKPILSEQSFSFYDFEQLSKCTVFEGELDKEKFESGEYVLAVAFNGEGDTVYHAGDEVVLCNEHIDINDTDQLTVENGIILDVAEQETKTYKVMAVVDDYYRNKLIPGFNMQGGFEYIFPTSSMGTMFCAPDLQVITIDVEETEYLEEIEPLIEECVEAAGEEVAYRSQNAYRKEMKEFGLLIGVIGNGLAFVVGIMSVVNFINNCVSGIAERKEEFKTLYAIGMTKEQLLKTLKLENLYTVCIAIVPGLLLGHFFSAIIIKKVSEVMTYFVLDITVWQGIVLALMLCLLAMIYPDKKTDVGF